MLHVLYSRVTLAYLRLVCCVPEMESRRESDGGEPPLKKPKLNEPCDDETGTAAADTHLTSSAESIVRTELHCIAPSSSLNTPDDPPVDGAVAGRNGDSSFECLGGESASQSPLHHTREEDVGISQYVSNFPGIFGVLKQRCGEHVLNILACYYIPSHCTKLFVLFSHLCVCVGGGGVDSFR